MSRYDTVKTYIDTIKKENHTVVKYRYDYRDTMDTIEGFVAKYGHMLVDINGQFHHPDGSMMHGTFIYKTA